MIDRIKAILSQLMPGLAEGVIRGGIIVANGGGVYLS